MTAVVNVLYLPGTNCHRETVRAFTRVGGEVRLVFLHDLLVGSTRLRDADVVCLPGGFSFGDHVGAGNVAAQFLRRRLHDQLEACVRRPMICICNGFQIAARAGVFGDITLRVNAHGTFRDEPRQKHLVSTENTSLWLRGLGGSALVFPCAHGEGRLEIGSPAGWVPALSYPEGESPDGSAEDVAGVTTPDGRVLGLMDHPERGPLTDEILELFRNGLRAAE